MNSTKVSTLKNAVSALVLTSLVGQQFAFAAPSTQTSTATPSRAQLIAARNSVSLRPTRLATATSAKEGVGVIQAAESQVVAKYFLKGGTPDEVRAFSAELDKVAVANSLVGVADDLPGFRSWWKENQTSVILQRSQMTTTNLQGLFFESYLAFKAQKAIATNDPDSFTDYLQQMMNALTFSNMSATTLVIVVAAGTFLGKIVHGAVVAGPVAGVVSAYLDSVVRPFKEKFAVWGGRNWGWLGAILNRKLNPVEKEEKLTAEEIESINKGLTQAKTGHAKTTDLLKTMGYEMNAGAFTSNVEQMREIWNEVNRSWAIYTPASYKDGRSLFTDAVSTRPFLFSGQVINAVNGAEIHRQSIQMETELIISRGKTDMKQTDLLVLKLKSAVAERERSDQKDLKTAQAAVDAAARELVTLGATQEQVERIVDLRSNELAMVRHAAAALAANLIHDFHYEEFNRSLPEEAQSLYRQLRSGYCLDFFHREFSSETTRILNAMSFRIEAMEKDLERDVLRLTPEMLLKSRDKAQLEAEPTGRVARAIEFVRASAAKAKPAAKALLGLDGLDDVSAKSSQRTRVRSCQAVFTAR